MANGETGSLASTPDSSCASCWFTASSPGGGTHCGIRGHALEDPSSGFCANHPLRSPQRDAIPIGPMMVRQDKSWVIGPTSPDNRQIRMHLLDIVESISTRRKSQLSARESAALWQLSEWHEARAFHVIDAIVDDLEEPDALLLTMPGSLHLTLLDLALRTAVAANPNPEAGPVPPGPQWLEGITIKARLLSLSALAVGSGGIAGSLYLFTEFAPPGAEMPIWVFVLLGIAAGAGWFYGGLRLFRRLGIPLHTDPRKPTPN